MFYWRMEKLKIIKLIAVLFVLLVFVHQANASFTLTADLDSRYQKVESKDGKTKVDALGVSLKKVFADTKGDRLILFTMIDAMDNFNEVMVDQGYLQYKGPMGKWNVVLGRYALPFGLLPNYSSSRLLTETLEYKTIGLSSDSGIQLLGVLDDFDYAFSLSQGVGVNQWKDEDHEPVVSFRLGHQGIDFEDVRIGLSGFWGKSMSDQFHHDTISESYKKLLALDVIKYHGPLVFRSEITAGQEDGQGLNGVFVGSDYAILPKTDVNLAYNHIEKAKHKTDALTVGITYNLFSGFQIRAAQKFSLKGEEDALSFQVYNIFTRTF